MTNPKVLFRLDAGKIVGTGHVMRCLALAGGFRQAGAEPLFLVNEQAGRLVQKRDNVSVVNILDAVEGSRQVLSDREESLIVETQPDLIVLDGYHFFPEYRLALAKLGFVIMVIDDNNDTGPLYADIILNSCICAGDIDYAKTAPGAVVLAGSDYSLLRPEFEDVSNQLHSPLRGSLLLTFGGSDPMDLSRIAVGLLDQFFPPETATLLVTGPLYRSQGDLPEVLRSSKVKVQRHHAVQNMAPLYLQTRLAISAAGSAQFELAATGTPALLAVIASNQKQSAVRALQEGGSYSFDFIDTNPEEAMRRLLSFAGQLWFDNEKLRAMANRALKLVRSGGALRAAEAVLSLLR